MVWVETIIIPEGIDPFVLMNELQISYGLAHPTFWDILFDKKPEITLKWNQRIPKIITVIHEGEKPRNL